MKHSFVALLAIMFVSVSLTTKAQVAYPRFQKHTVLEGETATSITELFNVTLQDFCLLNDFPENVKLKPGQVVLVKQLKEGEKEIVEDAPAPKAKPAKTETTKTVTEEKTEKSTAKTSTTTEEKGKPASTKTTTSSEEKPKTVTTTTTTTETTDEKPLVKEKAKPAPTAATEKPKPAPAPAKEKKTVASEEPFVVPPPSTKAVEVGPHGTVYNVSKSEYHIVQKNQTFFRIALIYGLSVDELKELNGLSNTTVEIGQKLKVRK